MLRVLAGAVCLVAATPALAFDAADLARLDRTGSCAECDLRGAELRDKDPVAAEFVFNSSGALLILTIMSSLFVALPGAMISQETGLSTVKELGELNPGAKL